MSTGRLQKITPHLWYAKEAAEAARCYASMVKLDLATLQQAYDGR